MSELECDIVVLQTLALLESRLRRLEFVLDGKPKEPRQTTQGPVPKRLEKLEESLHELTSGSSVISDILLLQSRHPELLDPPAPSKPQPKLQAPHKLAIVLTQAPAYQATASQLTSLNDLPIPSTGPLTSLVALQPRIAEVAERQVQQATEISELRRRSGQLVLRWHKIFIVGAGRCWVEWEDRLRKADREVSRVEVRRRGEGDL